MQNALFYYYHLYPESIWKKKGRFFFSKDNINYQLIPIHRSEQEIKQIVELNMLLPFDQFPKIIKNQMGQYLSQIENHFYLLTAFFTQNRNQQWNQFQNPLYLPLPIPNFPLLNHSNWYDLWIKKIDYFEYQKAYIKNKYPLLYNSLDYYIGLAENAISYIKEVENREGGRQNIGIAHRRLTKQQTLEEINDPLNIILDYQERDMAEYLKNLFWDNQITEVKLEELLEQIILSKGNLPRLLARLLFPSYYFDCYEKIINDIEEEKSILKYTQKTEDYEAFLKEIWHKAMQKQTLPIPDWLK